MRSMTYPRTLSCVGLAVALAAACGDSSGDDDDDGPGPTTSSLTGVPISTNSSTQGTSTTGSGTMSSSSNGSSMGGSGGTGQGGSAGEATGGTGGSDGGAAGETGVCEPDPDSGLTDEGSAGAAGAAGAPSSGIDEGYHFTDPAEVSAWGIKPVASCDTCIADATLEAGCGTMVLTANWPEEASTGTLKAIAEINAQGDARWDLSGRTVTVRVRWVSGSDTDNNGFNVYLEVNDEDWSYLGPALGETFDASDSYYEWSYTFPSAPEGDFDPSTVRQLNVRFDTKFWEDEATPPAFSYETTVFEIDAVVW